MRISIFRVVAREFNTFTMELKESEPRNLTDKIVESMSEAEDGTYIKKAEAEGLYSRTDKIAESMSEANAEDDAEAEADPYVEPLNRSIIQAEAERMLKPEPINRPIPAPDRESIYETPYARHIYRNYGGSRITIQNYSNEQSRNRQWSLPCLIIGLVIGLLIGATVTGLSMHFTKPPVCATLSKASPMITATPSHSTELGE